jgi:hypothetical protein
VNRCSIPRRSVPRRFVVAIVATVAVAAALVGSPRPVTGACAELLPFEEAASLPGAAVFTGRAVREDAEYRLVFEVDRWFAGAHPARIVLFRDELAGLVEEPEAGVVPAVLARTVAGDAFGFNRGELVIVTAVRNADGQYAPVICRENVLPVATPEGRALVAEATDLFGPGTPASRLPPTSTLPDAPRAAGSSVAWLPVAAFLVALAGALIIPGRRRTATTG